jgi:hypothetical protein
MHKTKQVRHTELRCACPQQPTALSPELVSVRFVLPHAVVLSVPEAKTLPRQDVSFSLPTVFFSPPDPPPRHPTVLSV